MVFYDPKRTHTKVNFSSRLYRTVFDESGTDRKLRVSPINLFYSHQKRRRVERLKKYVLVASLFARDFDHKSIFETGLSEMIPFHDPKRTPTKLFFSSHLYHAVFDEGGTDQKLRVSPIDPCSSRPKRRRVDPPGGTSYPPWRQME